MTYAARSVLNEKTDRSRTVISPSVARVHRQPTVVAAVPMIQRKLGCACAGDCPRCSGGVIQPKLTIGQPNDKYEQEADRVAHRVMQMPDSQVQRKCTSCGDMDEEEPVQAKAIGDSITPLVQRQAEEELEEEEEPAQLKSITNKSPPAATGNGVYKKINSLRGGGQPLPARTRIFFESRFGYDFGDVRVHTGGTASKTAKSLNAKAFTIGRDVVFGTGQYSPVTNTGKQLLAHELTHVIQQKRQTVSSKLQRKGNDSDCRSNRICSPANRCARPDPGRQGSSARSRSWTLIVNVDTEASDFESALRSQRLGHTYVKFVEGNGRTYTYGFYPRSQLPNEHRRSVPGCVNHPDTTHSRCVDERLMYSLNQNQYNAALRLAQRICRTGRTYGVNYTCTTYADQVVRAAGQSMPSSRSSPMSIYYNRVPAIDNPNTLRENIRRERQRAPNRRFPYWNNRCYNRCEAAMNQCFNTRRRGSALTPYHCLARRQRCMVRCPRT